MTEKLSELEKRPSPEVVNVADSSDEEVYETDVPFPNRLRQRRAKVYQNYDENEEDEEDYNEDDEDYDDDDMGETSRPNGEDENTRETFSPEIVGALPERRIITDDVYTAQHGGERPVVNEEYIEYGDSSMDEEEMIDGRKVIAHIADDFFATYKPNKIQPTFPLLDLPAETKKFCNILNDANMDFATDLPLHLYNIYLLTTRNRELPPAKFTLWPLPAHELITPRSFLRTTDFESLGSHANDTARMLEETKYAYVNYDDNSKLIKPSAHMLEFWHPKINPLAELDEALDAIYERKINSQIKKYSQDHKVTKKGFPSRCTYQRRTPEDIHLSPLLKEKIITKLDSIIDKLTDYHTNSIVKTQKISRRLGTNGKTPKRASAVTYGLDWFSVLSCLDDKDKHSKMLLLKLFNLKLDKDTINGPVNSYPIENELYTATKIRRDKILKNLICKSKVHLKNAKPTQYAKFARKQKNNISYNLDSFLNLGLYYTKHKRLKERNYSTESDI